MPNHVTNRLRIFGDEDRVQEIIRAVRNDEQGDGSIDFDKIIPMPQSLDIESGSRTDQAINLYLTASNPHSSYTVEGVEKMDADEFEILTDNFNRRRYFSSCDTDLDPESIADILQYDLLEDIIEMGRTAVSNMNLYGAKDWYEWCITNWGTKWNAYDLVESYEDNELIFHTAWSCPEPVIAKLAKTYPDVSFEHEWADEDIGNNVGRRTYEDGEEVECYIPESEQEGLALAFEVMCDEPEDWGYILNPKSGEYEYVGYDELNIEPELSAGDGPQMKM